MGVDETTRALISPRDLRDGMHYTVTSLLPRLSYAELDLAQAAPADDPSVIAYTDLPGGVHAEQIAHVREIARDVVRRAGATGAPFREAVALQNYLRTFTYDENVRLRSSIDSIENFLVNVKRGYCEQFATSMAVMARSLGLPARVAIGFAGGNPGPGADSFTITSRNAHAWVEIFFPLYGWVQFEPTPRSESVVVPSYTTPLPVSQNPPPEPTPTDTAEPTPTATSSARQGPNPEASVGPGTSVGGRLIPVGVVAGGLLVLVIVAFPFASRGRRVIRQRGARTAQERISLRYLDFLDWCAAAGVGRRVAETPLEHARRLAGSSSSEERPVEALARLAVGVVYAPPNGVDPEAVARLARQARSEVGAELSPRSALLVRAGWGWWRVDPSSRWWSSAAPPRRDRRSG